MKNVLLVAYYFPPSVDAGAKRAEGFFRHLPEYGYRTIVLTVRDGNYLTVSGTTAEERPNVVRVAERRWPARLRRRSGGPVTFGPSRRHGWAFEVVKQCYREIFYVPDGYRGFYQPACREALQIIRQQPIDVIFTTSGPYTLLRIGHVLSLRTGIPWVADFRDLWVENHWGYPYSLARRRLDSFQQTRWLQNACCITTATEGLKGRLQASGYGSRQIECVYNGYLEVPTQIPEDAGPADSETLQICFTGKLYEHATHTVTPFFEALVRIRESRPTLFRRLRADFYGIVNTDFLTQLERFSLGQVVRFHGMVSREEATAAQAAADVLLLLVPDTSEQEVTVSSKTFEYMATRKPLLAIVPEAGENARILGLAGMGRIFSPRDTVQMADYLVDLQAAKERLGRLPSQGDPRVIEAFSYRRLAGRLADVLDKAIGDGSAGIGPQVPLGPQPRRNPGEHNLGCGPAAMARSFAL